MVWNKLQYNGYEVSDTGLFRSFVKNKNGKILSLAKTKKGYVQVKIAGKWRNAHRLIAEAFIPNPYNKPQINHINGIKDDNRVQNLEWNTQSENLIHAYNIGLKNGNHLQRDSNGRYIKKLNNGISERT